MNTLTLRDLCCLFCCPPFPSNIAAKLGKSLLIQFPFAERRLPLSFPRLAFLPPEPTYTLQANSSNSTDNEKQTPSSVRYTITFSDKAEWQHSQTDIDRLEAYYVRTSRNRRVACFYVNCIANPKFYLLFSHGNAVDLGQMASFFLVLGTRLQCNIVSYDYAGYGASQGKPSEKNMYADIEATYHSMKTRYQIPESKIILYGQSIGKFGRVSPLIHFSFRLFQAPCRPSI